MNEAQTWMLLAITFGGTSTMAALVMRMVRSEVGAVRTEVAAVRTEIASVRSELGAKIDHLDRDVQTVINRLMG